MTTRRDLVRHELIGLEAQIEHGSSSNTVMHFGKILYETKMSRKVNRMSVINREYPRPVQKYERYERISSKVHAVVSACKEVQEGDEVKKAESRQIPNTASFVIVDLLTKPVN